MADAPTPSGAGSKPGPEVHTRAVRAGHHPTRDLRGLSPGLHRSSAYAFESAERGAAVHEGEEPGFFYGRMGSPTQAALEEAPADLEGGEAGLAFASGMAAISSLLLEGPGGYVRMS